MQKHRHCLPKVDVPFRCLTFFFDQLHTWGCRAPAGTCSLLGLVARRHWIKSCCRELLMSVDGSVKLAIPIGSSGRPAFNSHFLPINPTNTWVLDYYTCCGAVNEAAFASTLRHTAVAPWMKNKIQQFFFMSQTFMVYLSKTGWKHWVEWNPCRSVMPANAKRFFFFPPSLVGEGREAEDWRAY